MIETIGELKDVFDLAVNAKDLIANMGKAVKKEKKHDKDDEKISSSGYGAQIGSSGNSAQIGSSGNWARIESTGKKSVISAIGAFSTAKAKKGSWITLTEYRKNGDIYEVYFVKTEYVDGKKIKEDTEYTLFDKEFREVITIDGIKSALIEKKKSVYKVVNIGETDYTYIIEKEGVFSHGKTIKEAKESFIYKISNRDTSDYAHWTLKTKITKEEAIKSYRVITGACEAGTRYFMENLKSIPKVITPEVVIKLTEGQYGNETYKEFFGGKR